MEGAWVGVLHRIRDLFPILAQDKDAHHVNRWPGLGWADWIELGHYILPL